MKVKLIQATQNPIEVMWVSARTCYSGKSPIELWEDSCTTSTNKKKDLVNKVLSSGHSSIAEHVHFTFVIEGISRACSHQLVRHRLCTFSQQSQRYVEIKENAQEILQLIFQFKDVVSENNIEKATELQNRLTEIANTYFVDVNKEDIITYCMYLVNYLTKVEDGCKPEDARNFLPNATKTNLVLTTNLRNLMHISEIRLCTRAQKEIRNLFKLIKEEVTKQNEMLGSMLIVQCDKLGYCPEHKSCGRKPTRDEIWGKNESNNI